MVGLHYNITERFAVARIRVRNLWHLQQRLIRKVLAHTVGVFLNLQLGRPPFDLDGLLEARQVLHIRSLVCFWGGFSAPKTQIGSIAFIPLLRP